IVRFSRKTKEQYVTSEEGGKTTNWRAHHVGGKWIETVPPAKVAKKKRPAKRRATKVKGSARKKAAVRKKAAAREPAAKKSSAKRKSSARR
ncbi:MAG: hypothetical protein V3T64_15910, partial [Myxococcota bacterium]